MERDLDPHLMRAFVAVSEVGTISAAALRLARTQAAVSLQLQRLEADVGVALVTRSSRGVSLTEAGEILAAHARKLFAMSEDARRQIAGHKLAGRIRLGLVEDLAASRLPLLLAEFQGRHPQVQLDLVSAGSAALSQAIKEGSRDIVIAEPSRFEVQPHSHWSRQLVWAASRLFHLEDGDPIRMILFDGPCAWQDRMTAALAQAQCPWVVGCRVSTHTALIAALRAGLGVGLMLPETVPADCMTLKHPHRLPAAPRADFGLYMAQKPAAIVRELAEFLSRETAIAA